ncbi:MAG: hypothetical protein RMI91_09170 [Gemmatales bacterium]|nr:hypothetical protein [Gemmatales bacterium]MDW7994810.1 hypothetical protein [Gemmatales bacterium]
MIHWKVRNQPVRRPSLDHADTHLSLPLTSNGERKKFIFLASITWLRSGPTADGEVCSQADRYANAAHVDGPATTVPKGKYVTNQFTAPAQTALMRA